MSVFDLVGLVLFPGSHILEHLKTDQGSDGMKILDWILGKKFNPELLNSAGILVYQLTLDPLFGKRKSALYVDVPESEVYYAARGKRKYPSRMTKRPKHWSDQFTLVAGPSPMLNPEPVETELEEAGETRVRLVKFLSIYTGYFGDQAFPEPDDPDCPPFLLEQGKEFWKKAALSDEDEEINLNITK